MTYFALFLHDALYQFLAQDSPTSRESADKILLEILERDNFKKKHLAAYQQCISNGSCRPIGVIELF